MRKILAFMVISSLFLPQLIAQSYTLEFSRVLMVNSNVQTVPAGKVWKLESALPSVNFVRYSASSTSVPTPTATADYVFFVDGSSVLAGSAAAGVTCGYTGSSGSQSSIYICINQDMFPLWLPAGTTLAAGNNISMLSVIEFNLVTP